MSSILLSNMFNEQSSNKLNTMYNSNISEKMNIIEKNQIMQQKLNPGFLNQFDDLRFDNIAEPVGINQAFTTITGVNSSLQRNLDFQRGYSQFQKDDMHYNVVDKNDFTHNNMIQYTSKRDFDTNADRTIRKLETFTGSFEYYKPKKEAKHLFEPMSDLTYTHGMPVITDTFKNRYLPSNKNNNGNLPFKTNVRVLPGLDNQNQLGSHSVYRVLPKNVDTLRSDINQKISYKSKPLETIKKGEIRGSNPYLTKFKIPDFRETKYEDLLPSRSTIEAPKNIGKYTNILTMRNENDTYNPINAVNINIGNGPDKEKTKFEPSKKENYLNDNMHSITGVYNKPVMTNTKSFINYENQRTSTNVEYEAPVRSGQISGYTIDYKNVPLTTSRELMIHNNNTLGVNTEQKSYVFSNDMILPVTNREIKNTLDILGPCNNIKNGFLQNGDKAKITQRQYTNYYDVSNATGEIKQNALYNNEQAKQTLRQGINYNDVSNATGEIKQNALYNNEQAKTTQRQYTNYNDVSNTTGAIKQNALYNNDIAKPTIKETTIVSNYSGTIGVCNNTSYIRDIYDLARTTIKEQTEENNHIGHANANNMESSYVRDLLNKARTTIKEQTEENNHIGHANANNNESSYVRDLLNKARTTIKEQTEENNHVGHANANNIESTYVRDLLNKARTTIKEQTEENYYIGHANVNNIESSYVKNYNDIAKPTIKQTTIVQTPGGRIGNSNMGNYSNLTDNMKTTIKETTILEDYTGGLHGEIDKPISHDATNNVCLDDRREITTYNRTPNGKRDINGPQIDKDNVRLNEPILFSYVPQPHKTLDHSVMPTVSRNTIEQVYSMSKPVIESSSYYINPNFINTLNDNPYVNDIYHQKNL